MRFISILLTICCLGFAYTATAQTSEQATRREGDAALRRVVDAELRKIYDAPKEPVFLLMSSSPPGLKGCGSTEITGYYLSGELVRIVLSSWDSNGKHAFEYYMHAGALLLVYEDFEFFQETAPAGAWKNFKHIPSWERRVYFRNGEVGYSETTGLGASSLNAKTLSSSVSELRTLLDQARLKRKSDV
jgi:hypothetical protein